MSRKRKVYVSILILISLIVIYGQFRKDNEVQDEKIYIENEVQEAINNEVKFQGELVLDKEISLSIPSELYTYKNIPIKLDKSVVENLNTNGWQEHEFIDVGKGKYVILCDNRDDSYKPSEEENIYQAKRFIKDSGIEQVLKKKNIECEYSLQYIENSYVTFCYLLNEDERTGAYIRMKFQGENICSECIMNIYKVKELKKVPSRDIEEALKDSFYMGEKGASDINNYTVNNVVVIYYNGNPYYKFMATNNETGEVKEGYCLAVNVSK